MCIRNPLIRPHMQSLQGSCRDTKLMKRRKLKTWIIWIDEQNKTYANFKYTTALKNIDMTCALCLSRTAPFYSPFDREGYQSNVIIITERSPTVAIKMSLSLLRTHRPCPHAWS